MTAAATPNTRSSLIFERARPAFLARQRSNSLPPGFAPRMTSLEAGLMFSAAEKATSRRRNNLLLTADSNSNLSHSNSSNSSNSGPAVLHPKLSFPKEEVVHSDRRRRPQSFSQISLPSSPSESVSSLTSSSSSSTSTCSTTMSSTSRRIPIDLELYLQSLPGGSASSPTSPAAPRKRTAASPQLKSYADRLMQFTQDRLMTVIPSIAVTSPISPAAPILATATSQSTFLPSPSRPVLTSKFSDWTNSATSSRPSSITQEDQVFGWYASSTASKLAQSAKNQDEYFPIQDVLDSYNNPSNIQALPPMPVSQNQSEAFSSAGTTTGIVPPVVRTASTRQHRLGHDPEISYFTNYDLYLNQSSTRESTTWPQPHRQSQQFHNFPAFGTMMFSPPPEDNDDVAVMSVDATDFPPPPLYYHHRRRRRFTDGTVVAALHGGAVQSLNRQFLTQARLVTEAAEQQEQPESVSVQVADVAIRVLPGSIASINA